MAAPQQVGEDVTDCDCLTFLRTKALVLELLAAVCLVRGGHEIILSAFDNFKTVETRTEQNLTLSRTASG